MMPEEKKKSTTFKRAGRDPPGGPESGLIEQHHRSDIGLESG